MTGSASQTWTLIGLAFALLGVPVVVELHHLVMIEPTASSQTVREFLILSMTLFLLWIVRSRERLPLASIGILRDRLARSLARGLGLALFVFATLIGCLLIFGALGIRYGEGSAVSRSMPVTLLTIIRAAVSEEIFYRGFALERLQSLTGSKWIAAAVTLFTFAGFHYRQGLPAIALVFVIGAVITGFYLWKRDLIAAIFAHFLVDFVPNVFLPLVGGAE